MEQEMQEGLWDVERVAAYLGLKVPRIYEIVRYRRLRAVRIGRLLRFQPSDVRRFIERHTEN